MEASQINVRAGVISNDNSFRNFAGIPPGPPIFFGSIFLSKWVTPSTVIVRELMLLRDCELSVGMVKLPSVNIEAK